MSSFELERRRDEERERAPARPAEPGRRDLRARELLRLQQGAGNQAVGRMLARERLIQRVLIGGINVDKRTNMASWVWDGKTYHLNGTTDPPHITLEGRDGGKKKGATKTHYFFRAVLGPGGWTINDATSGQKKKKKFSDLPGGLQTWFQTNYDQI